jgi:MFS family permease
VEHKNNEVNLNAEIPTKTWITLFVLGLSVLITMYGETMLLPALPDIINDLHISYSTSSWMLTSYLITGAVMTPICGKLSDIYGRKKMILIIMIIYILGTILGGVSNNILLLLSARVIQGIGISMFPIAFGIIRDVFPPQKLAIAVGIFTSMFAAGAVVGLGIGGSIIQNLGWHMTFFTIVPFFTILWFIVSRIIHDTKKKTNIKNTYQTLENNIDDTQKIHDKDGFYDKKIPLKSFLDVKGSVFLAITITSFLILLTTIGNHNSEIQDVKSNFNSANNTNTVNKDHNSEGIILFLLGTSITFFILFIIIEKRSQFPLVDLNLLRNKTIMISNILVLTMGLSMFMVYQSIPLLVRSPVPLGFGGDAFEAAITQLPFMVVFLIFAPISGFIIAKIGSLKPVIAGSIIGFTGFVLMLIFHSSVISVSITLTIISTGLALINTGAFNIILSSTPIRSIGVSLSMTVVINLLGMSIGPAIVGLFTQSFQTFINNSGSYPSEMAYNLIFLVSVFVSLFSIILSLHLYSKMKHAPTSKI